MALKKQEETLNEGLSGRKIKEVFGGKENSKEKMILTTFSIAPSFKEELEELFSDMGLGWAAGIRFALKEFAKKYNSQN